MHSTAQMSGTAPHMMMPDQPATLHSGLQHPSLAVIDFQLDQ